MTLAQKLQLAVQTATPWPATWLGLLEFLIVGALGSLLATVWW